MITDPLLTRFLRDPDRLRDDEIEAIAHLTDRLVARLEGRPDPPAHPNDWPAWTDTPVTLPFGPAARTIGGGR